MKLHEREQLAREAEIKLGQFVLDMRRADPDKGGLTDIEAMQVVLKVLGDTLGGYFKYALRFERHGDFETAGVLAGDEDKDPLKAALLKIAAIKNKSTGSDWDEIDEARSIARDALYTVSSK